MYWLSDFEKTMFVNCPFRGVMFWKLLSYIYDYELRKKLAIGIKSNDTFWKIADAYSLFYTETDKQYHRRKLNEQINDFLDYLKENGFSTNEIIAVHEAMEKVFSISWVEKNTWNFRKKIKWLLKI